MASVASLPRLAMHGVVGQPRCVLATCAQARRPLRRTPVSSTCSTGACCSAALSLRLQRRQRRRALLHPRQQRPERERRAAQVGEQLAHPAIGHELLLAPGRRQARAGADRTAPGSAPPPGRRPHDTAWQRGTADVQRLVLGHEEAHPRQVLHLPPLPQHHRCLVQRRLAAQYKAVGRCSTTASGVATRCSVSPRCPNLSTRLLAAALAQAASSCAPARRSTAACRCCGYPWPDALPAPARVLPAPSSACAVQHSRL